ncbi:MAG: BrnT family toxin [Afipia sp.]
MADENATLEFLAPAEFEWDEDKNAANLAKHGIDFDDAIGIFYGPILVRQSNRNNEERWIAIGCLMIALWRWFTPAGMT